MKIIITFACTIFIVIGCDKNNSKEMSSCSNDIKYNRKIVHKPSIFSNGIYNINSLQLIVTNNTLSSFANLNKVTNIVSDFWHYDKNSSIEERTELFLAQLNVERLTEEQTVMPGIANFQDAANKIFDITRPLTSNDIVDLTYLDSYKLIEIIQLAVKYNLDGERILKVLEILENENVPPDIRALASYFSGRIITFNLCKFKDGDDKFKDGEDKLLNVIELVEELPETSELANVKKNALQNLQFLYDIQNKYTKCLTINKQLKKWIDKHSNAPDIKELNRSVLFTACEVNAKMGKYDKAIQIANTAQNINISKHDRERIMATGYRTFLKQLAKKSQKQ